MKNRRKDLVGLNNLKINLQLFAEKPTQKEGESDEDFAVRLKSYEDNLAAEKSQNDKDLDQRFKDFGATLTSGIMDQIKGLFPENSNGAGDGDPKPDDKNDKEEINIQDAVNAELAKRESVSAFNSFSESIGDVEGVDMKALEGLSPAAYSAMSKLYDTKKTVSDEDFDKLVEDRATELAKKMALAENKDDKGVKDEDANAIFKGLGLKARV